MQKIRVQKLGFYAPAALLLVTLSLVPSFGSACDTFSIKTSDAKNLCLDDYPEILVLPCSRDLTAVVNIVRDQYCLKPGSIREELKSVNSHLAIMMSVGGREPIIRFGKDAQLNHSGGLNGATNVAAQDRCRQATSNAGLPACIEIARASKAGVSISSLSKKELEGLLNQFVAENSKNVASDQSAAAEEAKRAAEQAEIGFACETITIKTSDDKNLCLDDYPEILDLPCSKDLIPTLNGMGDRYCLNPSSIREELKSVDNYLAIMISVGGRKPIITFGKDARLNVGNAISGTNWRAQHRCRAAASNAGLPPCIEIARASKAGVSISSLSKKELEDLLNQFVAENSKNVASDQSAAAEEAKRAAAEEAKRAAAEEAKRAAAEEAKRAAAEEAKRAAAEEAKRAAAEEAKRAAAEEAKRAAAEEAKRAAEQAKKIKQDEAILEESTKVTSSNVTYTTPDGTTISATVDTIDRQTQRIIDRVKTKEEAQDKINEVEASITMFDTIMVELKSGKLNDTLAGIDVTVVEEIKRLQIQREYLQKNFESRYQTPIRPNNKNLGVTAFRASETFPKIPFYIPGTKEIGELLVTPRVSDTGFLEYHLVFLDFAHEIEKKRETIVIPHVDSEKFISGLNKILEWTNVATDNSLRRRLSKSVLCIPEEACDNKRQGVSSTEIIFQTYEDGSTAGRIQRNKGRFSVGYNISHQSAALLSAYLLYMRKVGSKEFAIGVMSDEELKDTLFKD